MTRWEYEMNSELKELVEINGAIEFPYDITVTLDSNFEAEVWDTLIGIFSMLIEKNRKYGDSALNPARIFSKASNIEQLKVRLDDKLNRIKNAQDDEDEDVIADLIGYLVLLTVAKESL